MVSINATLVLQVIQLLVLIFVLNRLMFRPILKLTNEREAFLEKSKQDMKSLESEVERLKGFFLSKESEARKKASKEGVELKDAAMVEMVRQMEESSRSAATIRISAERKVQQQVEATRPLLEGQARILADDIVDRVMGRSSRA